VSAARIRPEKDKKLFSANYGPLGSQSQALAMKPIMRLKIDVRALFQMRDQSS
jgi:hypothetical protein